MRNIFFIISTVLIAVVSVTTYFYTPFVWILFVVLSLFVMGLYDIFQKKHTIRRNYPIIGRLRYVFELIRPELQQYFIESNTNGKPFAKNERSLIYQRSKNVMDTRSFGTELDLYSGNYEGIRHSIYPVKAEKPPRVLIGGPNCKQPYLASIFNISAMSFGALSENAVQALNFGAAKGKFFHNTGEGSISEHHLKGGDLVWQIGTGYFGCRDAEGNFSEEGFRERANLEQVKMIELKLSQGAKPGHGGVLPGVKNTPTIAAIRMVDPWLTILSPPWHSAFSDSDGLIMFIDKLRNLSNGKPVGFKLCLGKINEFEDICKSMNKLGIMPDFISVDGAEGGTGAAPMEFSDAVGVPLKSALPIVDSILKKYNVRQHIKIIASGKIMSGNTILKAISLGADLTASARGFMMSLGCIQALRCNSNDCPAGVATQNKKLMKGLVVTDKKERVYYFHRNTIHAVMELMGAAGIKDIEEAKNEDLFVKM